MALIVSISIDRVFQVHGWHKGQNPLDMEQLNTLSYHQQVKLFLIHQDLCNVINV